MKKKRKSQGEGGGVCTKNGSYCEKAKNRVVGQGRCERRSEAFVKFKKKKNLFFFLFSYFFFFFWGWGGRVGGGGGGSGWM